MKLELVLISLSLAACGPDDATQPPVPDPDVAAKQLGCPDVTVECPPPVVNVPACPACPDVTCPSAPAPAARRYYLTAGLYDGAAASTACASGFHLASVWELYDLGALRYDGPAGEVHVVEAAGPGPYMEGSDAYGWMRNGVTQADTLQDPGANCAHWTSSEPGHWGQTGAPTRSGISTTYPQTVYGAWFMQPFRCATMIRAWCVED